MMKTVLCHSVHKWQVLAKQVTNVFYSERHSIQLCTVAVIRTQIFVDCCACRLKNSNSQSHVINVLIDM